MFGDQKTGGSEILALTSQIVSAHVSNNAVAREELAQLIQSVFEKLKALAKGEPASVVLTPAVPIRRSVTETTSSASKTA